MVELFSARVHVNASGSITGAECFHGFGYVWRISNGNRAQKTTTHEFGRLDKSCLFLTTQLQQQRPKKFLHDQPRESADDSPDDLGHS